MDLDYDILQYGTAEERNNHLDKIKKELKEKEQEELEISEKE